jgi:hypothetical protein
MNNERKNEDRPEAYPKPSETDSQLQNQPEFIDQQPNEFHDKSISDIPSTGAADVDQANDPRKESKEQ